MVRRELRCRGPEIKGSEVLQSEGMPENMKFC